MKKLFLLTLFLASPAFGQSYNPYGDGGYSESMAQGRAEQENYNRMQSQAQDMYQQQQYQAQQQQMQQQINRQQQEINSFNSASPIERATGNY